jgi:hypothetical protein
MLAVGGGWRLADGGRCGGCLQQFGEACGAEPSADLPRQGWRLRLHPHLMRTPSSFTRRLSPPPIVAVYPCRAHLLTSGRLLLRRPSSPRSARTASLPLASRCCSPVRRLWPCAMLPMLMSMLMLTRPPALLLTGYFGLSMSNHRSLTLTLTSTSTSPIRPAHAHTDRSLANLPLVGAPASVAFGYVAAPAAPQPPADAAQLRCRVHDLRSRRLRLGFPCLLAPAFVACCLFSLRECNKLDPPPHPASASVSTLLTL